VFGVVAIFAVWLPLAYVAQATVSRQLSARFGGDASAEELASQIQAMSFGEHARIVALLALPNVTALVVAAFAGGFLVGKFGTHTTVREAATAGGVTACAAVALALGTAGNAAFDVVLAVTSALVTLAFATAAAAAGGAFGIRKRGPLST
jgi:hypothetical protein